ncbi:histone acetyltransferase KAT6B-like isoform X3 [Mytilus californianus]|uniref:histone acetyltransferase KAT6B-like isoform X3 n=1 Tax=Mytilus californianus TaxID=6549 RepID=UPI0022461AE7|nr:histone acetyltransferase KAT6B-like isoform X3 [Mytilus californianus]
MVKEGETEGLANLTYAKWILEAIEKIKHQKQQPNLQRIVHAVQQYHSVSRESIEEQLQLATKDGLIVRTFSKKDWSYRDPSKMPHTKRRTLKIDKKTDLTKFLVKAVIDLGEDGSSLKKIKNHLNAIYSIECQNGVDLTLLLKNCLKTAMDNKYLTKEGRSVKLGEKASDIDIAGSSSNSASFDEDSTSDMSFSIEQNMKCAKPVLICCFCLGDENKNRSGEPEDLISCADCGNSGHPTCLKFSQDLTEVVKSLRWQCIECKTCSFCQRSGREDNMLFCDTCDRGFHMECCDPPLTKAPKGKWKCNICDPNRGNKKGKKYLEMVNRLKEKYRNKEKIKLKRPAKKFFSQKKHDLIKCPTPGCDSTGNVNGKSNVHRSRLFCPLVTPEQRKRYKLEKKYTDNNGQYDSDSEFEDRESPPQKPPRELPPNVTDTDKDLFKQAQEKAQEVLKQFTFDLQDASKNCSPMLEECSPTPSQSRFPPCIEFGKYEIQTWYSSPYPQEYARLPKLYICEFCLRFVKSRKMLARHMEKCGLNHPPANEIYRKNELSVFEVDGNSSKIYCQNLCLLAKLFLDHKTLYYDVEPFLFYVVTTNDEFGCHLIGYFSKEKHCQQKYNVSCIMTMPQYQRKGYGRFLIDFSYLLSRIEGQAGSPEKPLSDLGKVSYLAYWKSVIIEYLHKYQDARVSIKAIARESGMSAQDVAITLHDLKMLVPQDGKVVLALNKELIDNYMAKLESKKHLRVEPDQECLRWTPLISNYNISEEEKKAEKELSEMSDMVDSIAEDREWIETVSPTVSPHKLERSLSTSLSPRRLDLKSPMEEKSPVKIPPKEEDMELSSSSSSEEESDHNDIKINPPVIKLGPPPKRRPGRPRKRKVESEEDEIDVKKMRQDDEESDNEEKIDDKENLENFVESKSSSQQSTDEPTKRKRGWPKGVPRGSPFARKTGPKGRPKTQRKDFMEASVAKVKEDKCDKPKKEFNDDSDNESIETKRSENFDSMAETKEKDVKSEEDLCVNNFNNSAKLLTDKISETEAATKNVELEMEESKDSSKCEDIVEEDKGSDIGECDSANVSREAEDAVQALQVAEQGDSEEGKSNSPDSCEQERQHLTPELSVSGPSPASQPCVTDCISDTNSDVPAPLTPQVPTPPPSQENLSPNIKSVSNTDSPTKTSPSKSDSMKESDNNDKSKLQNDEEEDSTSDDDIPSDDNYHDDFNDSPPGAPAPVTSLLSPPPQPVVVQQSPIQMSPVQQSPVHQSPIQASSVQQSPVQQSPIQHSPLQPSPIQHSPIQQSPMQPSPMKHSPVVQKQPGSAKSFHETFAEDLPSNFDQLSNSSTSNLQSDSLPQQQEKFKTRPPQNQNSCSNFPSQVFPQNSSMGQMTNTNIGSTGFGNEMDVSQLQALESPASIGSNEMPNSNNSAENAPPSILSFMDCAEAQSHRTYSNACINNHNSGRYMDMVSSSYPVSSCGSFISPVPSGANIVQNFCPPPVSTYALQQQQQQQQQNSTHRLSHSNSQCRVQQPPSVSRQNSGPGPYPPQNISCDLAKLQQLTNGIPDLMPNNTMTPPPNLTPPPTHNMTPPPMMRGMTTPPVPNQQNSSGLVGPYKQYQQQPTQRQRSSSVRKSPNVTVNPNMTFTPNVTIRPGSNMITGYNNLLDSYRMRQPMINPGYINHGFPLNQLGQTPQLPMQMLNMNMNMNMNMNPAQQHFPQHMQPSQSNNMYAYSYINGSLPPSLNNMNGMMRR